MDIRCRAGRARHLQSRASKLGRDAPNPNPSFIVITNPHISNLWSFSQTSVGTDSAWKRVPTATYTPAVMSLPTTGQHFAPVDVDAAEISGMSATSADKRPAEDPPADASPAKKPMRINRSCDQCRNTRFRCSGFLPCQICSYPQIPDICGIAATSALSSG